MHDAVELPNDVSFFASSIVDSGEAFGVPNVGKDWFNCAHSVAVSLFGFRGVDFISHGLAERVGGLNTKAQVFKAVAPEIREADKMLLAIRYAPSSLVE